MSNIVIESVHMAAANAQVFSISPIDLHVSCGDSLNNRIDIRPDLFVDCSFSNSVCNDVLSGARVASPRIELVSAVDVQQGHTNRVTRGRGGIAWFIPCRSCVAVELGTCRLSISSVAPPLDLADVRTAGLDCDGVQSTAHWGLGDDTAEPVQRPCREKALERHRSVAADHNGRRVAS